MGLGDGFVTLEAKWFAQMFGMEEGSVYGQLKAAMDTLFNRFIVVRDVCPEDGKERVSKLRWISRASYIDGAGKIQIRFATDIVPYITRLEAEFTRYKLEKVAQMTSAYAVRLYELLMQWGSVGQREVELEWLRKALMLENEYKAIKDFKKWVIDVALTQINQYSDLNVSYTQRKTGRTVTHFIFSFSLKEEPKPKKAKSKKAAEPAAGSREYIEKHALPGESWDQAERRLRQHG